MKVLYNEYCAILFFCSSFFMFAAPLSPFLSSICFVYRGTASCDGLGRTLQADFVPRWCIAYLDAKPLSMRDLANCVGATGGGLHKGRVATG